MFAKLSQQDLFVSLDYDIEYTGAPKEWIERSQLPLSANAMVKGGGFSVFRQWLNPLRKVKLNLSKVLPSDFNADKLGSISDSLLKTAIRTDFSNSIKYNWNWSSETDFIWPELVRTKIKLVANYTGQLEKKGYSFTIRSNLDSLSIIAPKSYIDSLIDQTLIVHYKGKFKGRGEHKLKFEIDNPYPKHVFMETRKLEAFVNIRRTTTLKRKIPILAKGFGESSLLEMAPSFVECTLIVEFGEYDEMLELPIIATVHKVKMKNGQAPIELEFPKGSSSNLLNTNAHLTNVFILE